MKRILIILSAAICLIGGVLALSSINNSSIFRKNVETLAQQARERVCFRIVDENGEPAVGVTVKIKGTNNGSISDLDGVVCIEGLKKGDTLEISYIGYRTQEIVYRGQNIGTVTLTIDDEILDEVIYLSFL